MSHKGAVREIVQVERARSQSLPSQACALRQLKKRGRIWHCQTCPTMPLAARDQPREIRTRSLKLFHSSRPTRPAMSRAPSFTSMAARPKCEATTCAVSESRPVGPTICEGEARSTPDIQCKRPCEKGIREAALTQREISPRLKPPGDSSQRWQPQGIKRTPRS